jgi:hypothetical protein
MPWTEAARVARVGSDRVKSEVWGALGWLVEISKAIWDRCPVEPTAIASATASGSCSLRFWTCRSGLHSTTASTNPSAAEVAGGNGELIVRGDCAFKVV